MKINKILAVAITEYEDPELNKVENCKSDLDAVIKVLTEKYSFDDITFIHEKEKTTRKELHNFLNSYFINCLENENILFIYAGHSQYNPSLSKAYWQPSDSNHIDSSTWLSFDDITSFVGASQANHIGLIFDSCYSGAIFQPNFRGGGIDAFNSKSRLALTSGGIEKVSDGRKGELGPFAKSLVSTLVNNTIKELNFNQFANNVILEFSKDQTQTPKFGGLFNVGHEGGALIFELRKEIQIIQNENTFLKDILSNLYIPISTQHASMIKNLQKLYLKKVEIVQTQQYERAAQIRDEEKAIEDSINSSIADYIDSLAKVDAISKSDSENSKQLDIEIDEFEEGYKEAMAYQLSSIGTTHSRSRVASRIARRSQVRSSTFNISQQTDIGGLYHYMYTTPPDVKLFIDENNLWLKKYKDSLIQLLTQIRIIKKDSKSVFLNSKESEIRKIIIEIYKYQIDILIKGDSNQIDNILRLKELDMKVLTWIKSKNTTANKPYI